MDVGCYDCELMYGDLGWADFLVPNNIWKLINPSEYKGAGILCVNCIIRRCAELDLESVPFLFTSGPFADDVSMDLNKEFIGRGVI